MLAGFLDSMKAAPEGESTLLDRTAIFYASNLGNSSSHDNTNLPILLAGGAGERAELFGLRVGLDLGEDFVRGEAARSDAGVGGVGGGGAFCFAWEQHLLAL